MAKVWLHVALSLLAMNATTVVNVGGDVRKCVAGPCYHAAMRFILAALIAMFVIVAATPTAAESIAGDVNADGVVNSVDAFHLLQFRAGIICSIDDGDCQTWISHNFREKADVNDDGIENALDAVLILQFHAGLIPTLANAKNVPPT